VANSEIDSCQSQNQRSLSLSYSANATLQLLDAGLHLGDELLELTDTRLFDWLVQLPDYTLHSLALHYPFQTTQLDSYLHLLDINLLSQNAQIQWTDELWGNWLPRLNLTYFLANPAWTHLAQAGQKIIAFIQTLPEKQQIAAFKSLSANPGYDFSDELLAQYADCWDWQQLSSNTGIQFSQAKLQLFKQRWHWPAISNNSQQIWDESLIESMIAYWDWRSLCANPSVSWKTETIRLFKDYIHWESISRNPALPVSAQWLSENHPQLQWQRFSANPILADIWSEQWFEPYLKHINFEALTRNPGKLWSRELIQTCLRYIEIDESGLLVNPGVGWSLEWLDQFVQPEYLSKAAIERGLDFALEITGSSGVLWSLPLLEKWTARHQHNSWFINTLKQNNTIWQRAIAPLITDQLTDRLLKTLSR
jgi:hypothetical protein